MGYAVVHMQKIKSGGVRGIQSHNNREKPSRTNLDIDYSRSRENYDLICCDNYAQVIRGTVKCFATDTKTVRKDAVVYCSFIVASDEKTMKAMSPEKQKAFFEDSMNWFVKRYGAENIVNATVHMDETTPHMHIGIVPIKDNRLSAKALFDRKELTAIQTDFAKEVGERYGLERGKEGSERTHLSEQRFKMETVKQKTKELEYKANIIAEKAHHNVSIVEQAKTEMKSLLNTKNALECQINALQENMIKIDQVKADFYCIENIKVKKALLGGITIGDREFEWLRDLAKKSVVIEKEVGKLEKENHQLQETVDSYKTRFMNQHSMEHYREEAEKQRKLKELEKYKDYIHQTGQEAHFEEFAKTMDRIHTKERSR
ncbi:MobV family relaxase [Anaerotignum sp.]|uniref:MobV family relaxase n=1 Tax=Anaerotignum sp. TaxID=2039241 RepID=UPI0028B172D9|nr:MobV family relaxase [Anaerotignum sp.]